MNAYPANRFVTLHQIDGRAMPAYAPNPERDPLEAYAPFLHETQAAAEAEIAEDVASHNADLDGKEEFLDDETSYWAVACTIAEEGTLTYEGGDISRADIFDTYGVADPAAPKP